MKNDTNHIDDLFRASLDGYESPPSDQVFEKAFSTWQGGGVSSFNFSLYTVVTILILGSFTAVLSLTNIGNSSTGNGFQSENMTASDEYSIADRQVNGTQTIVLENHEKNLNNTFTKENALIADNTVQSEKQNENIQPDNTPLNNEAQSDHKIENSGTNNLVTNDVNETNRKTNGPIQNIKTNLSVSENLTSPSNIALSEDNNSNTNSTGIGMSFKESVLTLMSPVYPGIKIPDFTDSLVQRNAEAGKSNSSGAWSLEIIGSGMVLNSTVKALKPEAEMFSDQRNNALEDVPGTWSFALLGGKNWMHFFVQTGFCYTSELERTNYGLMPVNPFQQLHLSQNGNPYTFQNGNNYYLVDTPSGYWHYTYVLDSVIHVDDSVWAWETDTTQVWIFDSLYQTAYHDTLDMTRLDVRYSLVEVPLYFGYESTFGRFGYRLQAGILPGLLVRQSGQFYNGSELVNVPSSLFPSSLFCLSGEINVSAIYSLTDQWVISAGPRLKKSILPLREVHSAWQQSWTQWGVQFGIKYFFR